MKVDFHEDREPTHLVIRAVCVEGIVLPSSHSTFEEIALLEMMSEYNHWRGQGVEVPAVALCLVYGCLHLTHELKKRLDIRRAIDSITRSGEERYTRGSHQSRTNLRAI